MRPAAWTFAIGADAIEQPVEKENNEPLAQLLRMAANDRRK